jgi:hypothetical protein
VLTGANYPLVGGQGGLTALLPSPKRLGKGY